MQIGSRLRELRLEAGWTQSVLASSSNIADSHYNRIECNAVMPRIETLERIAGALSMTVQEIFDFDKDEVEVDIPSED